VVPEAIHSGVSVVSQRDPAPTIRRHEEKANVGDVEGTELRLQRQGVR
jgi:hypothetical protein